MTTHTKQPRIGGLHIGRGTTVGALTLFPIWQDRTSTGRRRYDTDSDHLQVAEADEGDTGAGPAVPQLAGQTGVLVGIGGQPLTVELFDHPQTLHEQLEALVLAACLDAVDAPAVPTPGRRARRMAEQLDGARLDLEPDVGQSARLGRARTDAVDAMALSDVDHQNHRDHGHPAPPVHLRATRRRHPILQAA